MTIDGDESLPTPSPRVTIRLYGGLLGDCFLLRFHNSKATMLIDFGVLQHMEEGEKRLPKIAADIKNETGGELDIIVATHRHWDHVCGFSGFDYADSVKAIWLSWIENPKDAQGRALTGNMETTAVALASAIGEATTWDANTNALAGDEESKAAAELMLFLGEQHRAPLPDAALGKTTSGAPRKTTSLCIEELKRKVSTDRLQFLEPGQSFPIGNGPAVAHVLGPPRDEARLRDQEPSADKHEVYPLAAVLAADADAALATGKPNAFPFDQGLPFPPKEKTEWLDRAYTDGPDWRKISASAGIAPLALSFDRIVNNTSLVLAIELEPGGDVLLFPGDAQVGNWKSWHDITWPEGHKGLTEDLLSRTVFLKVGHHGSINATVREGGLEAMTSPDLSAFIPVVEKFAKSKSRPWDMPHGSTLARLNKLSAGRVALGDRPAPTATGGRGNFRTVPAGDLMGESPFYIEYEI